MQVDDTLDFTIKSFFIKIIFNNFWALKGIDVI